MMLLVFVIIARHLSPTEFGLVAFAAIFTDLTRALALSGIPQALVRDPIWDDNRASTAFWLNFGLSLILAVLLAAGVGTALEWGYGRHMGIIVAALSITFVVEASSSVHEARLQREFGYRVLANRLLVGTIAGGVVGVAMAVGGFGIWALVGSRIANSVVQAALLWITVPWRPSRHYSSGEARPLVNYALHLGSSAIIGKLNNRIPELLLGIIAGLAPVGLYRVGSRAVFMIQDAVISPLQSTTLTAFSRAQEKDGLVSAYTRIVKLCGLLAFPVYGGAAVIATDFTSLVFGSQWHLAGQVMSALAAAGAASALLSFTQPALVAVGWTRLVLLNNLATFAIALVLTLALSKWGAVAVAWGYCVRAYLSVPLSLVLLRRAVGINVAEISRGLVPSFLSACAMAAVLWLAHEVALQTVAPLLRMSIMIGMGALLYPLFLYILGPKLVRGTLSEFAPVGQAIMRKFGRT
jgi:PST family polysaccharide transporter